MRNILLALLLLAAPAFADGLQSPPPTTVGLAQPGQIPGETTASSATAGKIGEVMDCALASAGTALTSGSRINVCSVSLTSGDWDCSAVVSYNGNTSTIVTQMDSGISQTSVTFPVSGNPGRVDLPTSGAIFSNDITTLSIPPTQELLSGTTPVYLVASAGFTVSTASAYGNMHCRRAR